MGWATAQIVAPSVGGYIAGNYSYNLLWWIVFAITIIAGFGYIRLEKAVYRLTPDAT
jgi:MFS family permease